MPQAITPTLRFARRGLACSILLFAACVAPRQGEVGTVADFDVLLNEGGAEVVQGNLTGDPLDPSDHPAPVPTAEDVSRMLAGVAEAQKEPEPEPEPDPGLSAEAQAELELLDLYIRFGERIIPARMPDGTIFVTKPYIMPVGKAEKVKLLIHALEPFPWGPRPEAKELPDQPGVLQRAPQNPEVVCWELLPKWDEEYYGVLSSGNVGAPPAAPGVVSLGDAFIITAVPDHGRASNCPSLYCSKPCRNPMPAPTAPPSVNAAVV